LNRRGPRLSKASYARKGVPETRRRHGQRERVTPPTEDTKLKP
jgi:hypothetical protein